MKNTTNFGDIAAYAFLGALVVVGLVVVLPSIAEKLNENFICHDDEEYGTYYNVTITNKCCNEDPKLPTYSITDQNGRIWYMDCSDALFENLKIGQSYFTKIGIHFIDTGILGQIDANLHGLKYVKTLEIVYDVPNIYGVIEKGIGE